MSNLVDNDILKIKDNRSMGVVTKHRTVRTGPKYSDILH